VLRVIRVLSLTESVYGSRERALDWLRKPHPRLDGQTPLSLLKTDAGSTIGATVVGILGPVFIPWMVFDKTDFPFWGWLKAFLGFEFYKVVAAATLSIVSHLLITYLTSGAMNVASPQSLITLMPALLMLCFIACFVLFKIPTMTASLFSGHTGGHGIGIGGIISAAVLKGL
jgi:type IV secretory pathway VirB6-like protein